MGRVQKHLRNTFLAGMFAAVPLAVTVFIVWYVERSTREPLRAVLGINVPFLGILVALGLIYLLGLAVSSLVGRWVLRTADKLLSRVPLLKELYRAWKQVTLTPGGKEGMYAKVVLVPGDADGGYLLGFTSGESLPGDTLACCVFVPNVPNPMTGRIMFVRRDRVLPIDLATEEAFKLLLSGGNYVPGEVRLTAHEVPAPSSTAN
jgi:uncharacterized membrane protein